MRLPLVENKKHGQSDATKTRCIVPPYFLAEIKDRESGEHRERDDLLNGLQLRGAEFVGPDAVRRDLKAILEKGNSPAHQDHFPKSGSSVLEMAIPGKSHKDIRNGKQEDSSHVFPVPSLLAKVFFVRRGRFEP